MPASAAVLVLAFAPSAPIDKQVFKCDLCDGDPQCVRFCEEKAVDFVDADEVCLLKTRDAAERVSAAGKSASALEAQL
jgi:Fe-S-cluster-containing hydrogenase component 2